MSNLYSKIKLRKTEDADLSFVPELENHDRNKRYIRQWSLEAHQKALSDENIHHMIIEDEQKKPVGYAI